jgi:hypothetical protein
MEWDVEWYTSPTSDGWVYLEMDISTPYFGCVYGEMMIDHWAVDQCSSSSIPEKNKHTKNINLQSIYLVIDHVIYHVIYT